MMNFRAMPAQAQGVPQRPVVAPSVPTQGAAGMANRPPMPAQAMKKGGMPESFGMKAKGRGVEKADMQKKAAPMKFAKGGSIDGCAQRGKTKGKMVKMAKGGSCK